MDRPEKDMYYLSIAKEVSNRSTCLRRHYGAVIVNNDAIVSTGYNGAPRGEENCIDRGMCIRKSMNIPHGERYEMCRAVHAEQNAIIEAPRSSMIGATIYISGSDAETGADVDAHPCMICKRMLKNAGIKYLCIKIENTVELEDLQYNDIAKGE